MLPARSSFSCLLLYACSGASALVLPPRAPGVVAQHSPLRAAAAAQSRHAAPVAAEERRGGLPFFLDIGTKGGIVFYSVIGIVAPFLLYNFLQDRMGMDVVSRAARRHPLARVHSSRLAEASRAAPHARDRPLPGQVGAGNVILVGRARSTHARVWAAHLSAPRFPHSSGRLPPPALGTSGWGRSYGRPLTCSASPTRRSRPVNVPRPGPLQLTRGGAAPLRRT